MHSEPLIQIEHLSHSYVNKQILDDVSLTVNKGQPIALVGPNGAGKTTLFSILCGYIKPTSGKVLIQGKAAGSAGMFGKIAALPQDAQLDPQLSISHQFSFLAQLQGFTKKQANIEVMRVLDLVGLIDAFSAKTSELSHGMVKRVSIAQTLIGAPEIVMLDEATAGLDPIHAREVRELVASLSSEITFILSSHDLSELERLCQQVLFLEHGILKQHQRVSEESDYRFITLRMKENYSAIIKTLSGLPGVEHIEQSQNNEYVISTKHGNEFDNIDCDILAICLKNQWQYAQLINGKTLENQLF
jgi:ABC-type multidrug transport system ATPase subunit